MPESHAMAGRYESRSLGGKAELRKLMVIDQEASFVPPGVNLSPFPWPPRENGGLLVVLSWTYMMLLNI